MADVNELTKLNRDQLNKLATQYGIEDAANEEKYATKKDLAKALSSNITPGQFDAYKLEEAKQPGPTPTEEFDAQTQQPQDQPAPPPIDSPDDVDDQSGVEPVETQSEVDEDVEEENPYPSGAGVPERNEERGMGYKMNKEGKTLSIFSNKVHETIRFVNGQTVPVTMEEYRTKSDNEIIEKLKEIGKI